MWCGSVWLGFAGLVGSVRLGVARWVWLVARGVLGVAGGLWLGRVVSGLTVAWLPSKSQ